MELVTLSRNYGDFYAPSYVVRLAGSELVRDLQVPVSQVEVDMVLGSAWHFSFTVNDAFDHKLRKFRTGQGDDLLGQFSFGASIEVCMGYGDASSMPTVLNGVITEVSTSFPETGAPELVVSGYDPGFLLTLGKSSESWRETSDSDVVQQIARFHNLNAVIDSTEKRSQIEQNQESDWDFLKKLAARNNSDNEHFELYVDVDGRNRSTLHFGRPRVKSAPVVNLSWGEGLLSFRPQANLAGQVAKVEVYGSDTARKEVFIGRADAQSDGGARAKSVAQHLGSLVRAPGKQPVLRLRQPVFTQAEADQRAKAALSERTREFHTADAETIGLPELRPDRTVQIDRIGDAFSKVYYIEKATHRIDASGYRTRFKVKETGL